MNIIRQKNPSLFFINYHTVVILCHSEHFYHSLPHFSPMKSINLTIFWPKELGDLVSERPTPSAPSMPPHPGRHARSARFKSREREMRALCLGFLCAGEEFLLVGGNSNMSHFHLVPVEMIQFDEHIFRMG